MVEVVVVVVVGVVVGVVVVVEVVVEVVVVMSQLVYLSATQIDNFRRCPRAWAWDKIARIPREENKSLELGSRVHDILEGFFKNNMPPNLNEKWRFAPGEPLFYPGEIAASMIPTLASVGLENFDVKTEEKFEVDSITPGIRYIGKIDLHYATNRNSAFVTIDHKTSSSPAQWGKKKEDLIEDTQNILYSRVLFERFPEALLGDFYLNYGSTKLKVKENHLVKVTNYRDKLLNKFASGIEPLALQMAELKRQQVDPLELPANPKACGMYSGCPYKKNCNLTSRERLSAFMGNKNLVAELLKKQAAKSTAREPEETTEVVAEATADPLNPPESVEENEEQAQEEAKEQVVEAAKPKTKKSTTKKKVASKQVAAEKPKEETKAVAPPRDTSDDTVVISSTSTEVYAIASYIGGMVVGANPELAQVVEDKLWDLRKKIF